MFAPTVYYYVIFLAIFLNPTPTQLNITVFVSCSCEILKTTPKKSCKCLTNCILKYNIKIGREGKSIRVIREWPKSNFRNILRAQTHK